VLLFVGDRGSVAERRVEAQRIVEALDGAEHRHMGLCLRAEAMPRQQLAFERAHSAGGANPDALLIRSINWRMGHKARAFWSRVDSGVLIPG